jgi:hypothetical protein
MLNMATMLTRSGDHITCELDKLMMREKYTDQEQIHAANDGLMLLL